MNILHFHANEQSTWPSQGACSCEEPTTFVETWYYFHIQNAIVNYYETFSISSTSQKVWVRIGHKQSPHCRQKSCFFVIPLGAIVCKHFITFSDNLFSKNFLLVLFFLRRSPEFETTITCCVALLFHYMFRGDGRLSCVKILLQFVCSRCCYYIVE